jgi:hypothetical protein
MVQTDLFFTNERHQQHFTLYKNKLVNTHDKSILSCIYLLSALHYEQTINKVHEASIDFPTLMIESSIWESKADIVLLRASATFYYQESHIALDTLSDILSPSLYPLIVEALTILLGSEIKEDYKRICLELNKVITA